MEKEFRLTPWEHVTHICGRKPDGAARQFTYHDAIRGVADGIACFYVIRDGKRIDLELSRDALGNKCLRTPEGEDILLSLPDHRGANDASKA